MRCGECRLYVCPNCVQAKAVEHSAKRRQRDSGAAEFFLSPGFGKAPTCEPESWGASSTAAVHEATPKVDIPKVDVANFAPPADLGELQSNLQKMMTQQTNTLQSSIGEMQKQVNNAHA